MVDDHLTLVQADLWPFPARLRADRPGASSAGATASWSRRQALRNYKDVQYTADITVGGQVVSGIIDTGSYELVVFERHCEGCGLAAVYNHDESNTYQPGKLSRSLRYGSGDLYAREGFDLVSVGAIGAVNQSFWESTEAYMPVLERASFQSIIGVGPPETPAWEAWSSTAKVIRRLQDTLGQQGNYSRTLLAAANSMAFSVEISRLPTLMTAYGFRGFSLCLGNRPESSGYFIWNDTTAEELPASFRRVPVVGRHSWTVKMTDVRLGLKGLLSPDQNLGATGTIDLSCAEGCGAIVDSGSSFLLMPRSVVILLEETLSELDVNCSNMNELPDLVFNLGEHTFSLPPDAYLSKVTNPVHPSAANLIRVRDLTFNGACELSVLETTSQTAMGPLWILGMPFFRKYYTTFSLGRSRDERALLVAQAGADCYPINGETSLHRERGTQVFSRQMDLSHSYISPLVAKALSTDQLDL